MASMAGMPFTCLPCCAACLHAVSLCCTVCPYRDTKHAPTHTHTHAHAHPLYSVVVAGLEEPDTPEDTPPEADQDGKQQGKPSLGGTDQPRDPTFEEALTKSDSVLAAITGKRRVVSEALKRLPTYRLPYQPE
eukprot:scaffold146795_cov21-Tisochrysis_lutea.AAC.1